MPLQTQNLTLSQTVSLTRASLLALTSWVSRPVSSCESDHMPAPGIGALMHNKAYHWGSTDTKKRLLSWSHEGVMT